jgi:tRNA(Ile)-lysidine synthase
MTGSTLEASPSVISTTCGTIPSLCWSSITIRKEDSPLPFAPGRNQNKGVSRSHTEKRFLRCVAESLQRIGVARDALVLVALSGGPDSVALFHALSALRERCGYRLVAAHLNHGIRGAQSDRDEAFVRELCARCATELILERAAGLSADLPNLEERAREVRQAFLHEAAERAGAQYIAIAHQADDQAETVLMRMLRGAGAAGLAAMAERGPGRIIRPMLAVTRDEVDAYLEGIGEESVNDSSNQSAAMLRNRIRAELMPMLERNYAPGLRGRLAGLAAEMRALDDFVSTAARREIASMAAGDGLDISRFAGLHPALQAEVIRQYLKSAGGSLRRIERVHIDAIRQLCLDGPKSSPNGALDIPGLRIVREYGKLKVAPAERHPAASFMVRLGLGSIEIAEAGFVFEMTSDSRALIRNPASKFEALFDAAAMPELTVRNFRPGDRMAPLGMTGHRKVKDIFIDHKLAPGKRATFPVVELGGAIAWLPGMVRGRVGLVTEASEKVVLLRASDTTMRHQ